MQAIIIPIKPRYAKMIYSGDKTAELRKRTMSLKTGDVVLLYETAPVQAITGGFVVSGILSGSPRCVWRAAELRACVSLATFDEYFQDKTATAIFISFAVRLTTPVKLFEMKRLGWWKTPPQLFCFWRRPLFEILGSESSTKLIDASSKATAIDRPRHQNPCANI